MQAAEGGHLSIAQLLIAHGADLELHDFDGDHDCDINCRGYNQETPLMISSFSGHLTIAKLLLEHGAKVDLQDADGDTTLIKAARGGHSEVANVLKLNGADEKIQN